MQNNYYYIRQLSVQLKNKLIGWQLATLFSQEKDELVIGFCQGEEEFYIKAVLKPDFACLVFPESFSRARRNSVELFTPIIGLSVLDIIQYTNERSFAFVLEKDYLLLFKMHGNRSNIILFKENKAIDLFHNKLVADLNITPDKLHRNLDQSVEAFQEQNYQTQALYPTLGKLVLNYLQEEGFGQAPPEKKWQQLQEVVRQLENPTFYITSIDHTPTLSLLPVGEIVQTTTDAVEAANFFYNQFARINTLEKEKKEIIRYLEKKISRTTNYLTKTYDKLSSFEEGSRNEQLANILMANLHQIPPRSETVELFDFYHNKPLTLKLKPDLSPQRNAEVYYRKAKNEKIEIAKIQEAIEQKEKELEQIKRQIEEIARMESLKEFRKYVKENKLLQEGVALTPEQLFKKFEYMNYEILVGRNAKNNDLLTQKYAFKEDLWLHAKDVTGSHVIIKYQAGKNFPQPVIERAAGLAAYYSKLRNDTVCPVIVTPKKYVRKPKGLPEGAVVIDREEVLLVAPVTQEEL